VLAIDTVNVVWY